MIKIDTLCVVILRNLNNLCDSGYPYEQYKIDMLDNFIEFSNKNNMKLSYLSLISGIHYSDDILSYKVEKSKIDINKRELHYYIIGEQILRMCLDYNFNRVCFLSRFKGETDKIKKYLESNGISVINPILGYTEDGIRKILKIRV